MNWKLRSFVISIFAASFVAGMLTAPSAYAVNQINLYIHAGTSAGTVNMTCGWHGGPHE